MHETEKDSQFYQSLLNNPLAAVFLIDSNNMLKVFAENSMGFLSYQCLEWITFYK